MFFNNVPSVALIIPPPIKMTSVLLCSELITIQSPFFTLSLVDRKLSWLNKLKRFLYLLKFLILTLRRT